MSVDREYKIRIQTIGDNAAAESTAEGLKKVGHAGEEAGEQFKLLETHGKEWHKLMHELDEMMPGIGLAFKAVFNPAALGIGALVLAIEVVKSAIEAHKKKLEDAKDTAASVWAAEAEGAQKAAEAAHNFNDAMKMDADASGDMKKNLEGAKAVLEAIIDGHKKILDALEKEQLAEAAGDQAKEAAVHKRFDALKKEYDLTAESMRLEQLRDDLTKRQFQLKPKLNEKALQAESDLEEEQGNREAAAAKGRMEGKDEKALKKQVDEANETLHKYRVEGSVSAATAQRAQNLLDRISPVFEQYEKDKDTVARHEAAVNRLTDLKSKAVSQYQANNDAIKEETQQIKSGEEVLKQHRATTKQESAIERVEKAGGFGNARNIIQQGIEGINQYQLGHRLNQQQVDQIANMRALFESVNGNSVAIVNLIKQSLRHHVFVQQEVDQMKRDFDNLRSRVDRPRQ